MNDYDKKTKELTDAMIEGIQRQHRAPEVPSIWLPLTLSIAAIIAVTCTLAYVGSRLECGDVADETGLETRYSVWSGCYVRVNGRWVPKSAWREVPP